MTPDFGEMEALFSAAGQSPGDGWRFTGWRHIVAGVVWSTPWCARWQPRVAEVCPVSV